MSSLSTLLFCGLLFGGVLSQHTSAAPFCHDIRDRVDCSSGVDAKGAAVPALSESICGARGCCFDNSSGAPACFYPIEGKPVKYVHMINSNHFDAGYANFTAEVVSQYFSEYFPRACDVGESLRAKGRGPLAWMTFSWMISLFFDCPTGLGLQCPDAKAKARVEAGIRAGDIVWPAFPTNADLATLDPSLLSFGVDMSQRLARRFQVQQPSVVSTRDVPGMPCAALPILVKAGVTALSEGMNSRVMPVNVPPIFMWTDTESGAKLPTLWHWAGYGQLGEPGNPIRIPGSEHAIAYCWRGDNAGPPLSAEEVESNADRLRLHFGNTSQIRIISSTFEQFFAAVGSERNAEQQSPLEALPVITQQLTDSWLWGCASDPVKQQQARALQRARSRCLYANTCSTSDEILQNFSRLLMKNSEHTWGLSVFHYGNESDTDWGNAAFHRKLAEQEPHFMQLISSWREQRLFGVQAPIEAVPTSHPLSTFVEQEMAWLRPVNFDPAGTGFIKSNTSSGVQLGSFTVDFGTDGAISSLVDTDGTQWADGAPGSIGLLQYQTLVYSDFETWRAEYLIPGTGGDNEYGKPVSFMDATPKPQHRLAVPKLTGIWTKQQESQVILKLQLDSALVEEAGAPEFAWLVYSSPNKKTITARLELVNKTSTRLPEATYLSFRPAGSNNSGAWEQSIISSWTSPLDIADGGARGLHYVSDEGVRVATGHGSDRLQIRSLDAGLLRWGAPLPFPTPIHGATPTGAGASFNLHNNIWNTNFPLFMPFDGHDSLSFRFELRFEREQTQGAHDHLI